MQRTPLYLDFANGDIKEFDPGDTLDNVSGIATSFTDLNDSPAGYTSNAGKFVRVNATETALEFVTLGSGSGDVVGPASSVANNIVTFDGTTGKLIKDSGVAITGKADAVHTHVIGDVTGLQTALDGKESASNKATTFGTVNDTLYPTVKLVNDQLALKADVSHTHSASDITSGTLDAARLPTGIDAANIANGTVSNAEFQYLDGVTSAIQTQINGKAATSHTHSAADITSGTLDAARLPTGINAANIADGSVSNTEFQYLNSVTSDIQTQLNGKEPTITNGFGITGTTTKSVALTSTSAYATAETTISTATYADITGCSISLAAGTWLIIGNVNARAVNAIIQVFIAITDGSNNVISEGVDSRPASGTANLNSPFGASVFAIVSPASTTTYKLRGARGLTTHTSSWIAMDGSGYNTTNHASNNSDEGTVIMAIRIA